ncbi:hypothetical protein N6H13_02085 [Paenibacillus sp. CC-CFT742]|nr:hypothetical protein [Paenibacillus sp. CC-CFT742]WJH29598.1 hypothetical protein N6H13_02085 [Paenibacillus sp. CC-CFT742]
MNQSLTQQAFAGLVHSLENRLVRVKSQKGRKYGDLRYAAVMLLFGLHLLSG